MNGYPRATSVKIKLVYKLKRTPVLDPEEREQQRVEDEDDRGPNVDLRRLTADRLLQRDDVDEHHERERKEAVCSRVSFRSLA